MCSGEKLRLLRLLKGYKQQFVADKLGISQQAYSKLEKKEKINESLLKEIFQHLHCSHEEIDMVERIEINTNSNDSSTKVVRHF